MIARLSGVVIENEGSSVVIDCNGVGYQVSVCQDDQGHLVIGDNVEQELYLQLTSVNGVGPKAAMAILAVDSEDELRRAIAEGDTALLSRASGVGKKVAERIVVDLKNKVGLMASDDATDFLRDDSISDHDEALQALVALGYSVIDAKFALSSVDADLSVEKRVKQALRG